MTIKQLQLFFFENLASLYPKEEILSFFYLLAEHQLNLKKIGVSLNAEKELSKNDVDFFKNALAELKQEKPIQYIIGETEFYGLPFKVTKDVLIPRPETEELVSWILEECRVQSAECRMKTNNSELITLNSKLEILDVGTGSGCIAISLAKNIPNATVFALDVSKDALAIAKQNAQLNAVAIHFIEQDILNPNVMLSTSTALSAGLVEASTKFDIIVSNPPYVRELEKQEIKNNVLDNEPHLALFVKDNNPLLFYDKIADIAKQQLTQNGLLFFEINQYLGNETVALLQQKGFSNVELKKDLFGNDRMVKASLI